MAKIGLIQFLGSNCDQDCVDAFQRFLDIELQTVWHEQTSLPKLDGLILPGGFSYGDFLRGGALAAHTKIMNAVKEFVKAGGPVIGICNGFQMLTESGILPGTLIKNTSGKFVCEETELLCESGESGYHRALSAKHQIRIPVAHGEGRYFIGEEGLKQLEGEGRVLLRYAKNPNGSTADIAGILSKNDRVLGLMPHPERACDPLLGSEDGLLLLKAFLEACG